MITGHGFYLHSVEGAAEITRNCHTYSMTPLLTSSAIYRWLPGVPCKVKVR